MPISYPEILATATPAQTWTWTDRDFIHYASCLGFGSDPMDSRTAPYVFEGAAGGLRAVPTMPAILAWVAEPTFTALGVDPITALHGEQKIELHRPLPCPVSVKVQGRVVSVHDK